MSRRGKLADEENRVRIELARRGRNADLLTLLGDVLAAGVSSAPGKRDAAEQAYREAAALNPQTPRLGSAWHLYADSGEAGRAGFMYAEALKLQPDLPEASLRLAKLHLQQGEAAKAAQVYEAVLERHPQFVPALNNLAYLYSEQLDPKRAWPWPRSPRLPRQTPQTRRTRWAGFSTSKVKPRAPCRCSHVQPRACRIPPRRIITWLDYGTSGCPRDRTRQGRVARRPEIVSGFCRQQKPNTHSARAERNPACCVTADTSLSTLLLRSRNMRNNWCSTHLRLPGRTEARNG